ncbi:hypothetical protein Pan216_05060 [Planctomycetes bacterium Pan216]|uniref:Uncharacterized protein n=1 Tax=Kolteria novifilia TaxID=2527975 RepID=A0A518AY86_9BACT|nr:hypothetical protein Pan216_05060 [Planctomycetes bacterium Pan216]
MSHYGTELGQLVTSCQLDLDARRAIGNAVELEEALELLAERGLYFDAMKLLQKSLPLRDLVWWATLCVWGNANGGLSDVQVEGIRRVAAWVREPIHEHHQEVAVAADVLGEADPVGRLCTAASYTGCASGSTDVPEATNPTRARQLAIMALRLGRHHAFPGANRLLRAGNAFEIGRAIFATENHWDQKSAA